MPTFVQVLPSFAGRKVPSGKPNGVLSRFAGRLLLTCEAWKHALHFPAGIRMPTMLTRVCYRRGGAIASSAAGVECSKIATLTGHKMRRISKLFLYLQLTDNPRVPGLPGAT